MPSFFLPRGMLSGGAQAKDSLYVQGGLTVLLASYAGFSTGYVHTASDRVLWVNGVDNSTHGILKGTGWEAGVSGGFTIVKTPADYYSTDISREPYGLDFDGDLLPDGSYTVELVANPVGVFHYPAISY